MPERLYVGSIVRVSASDCIHYGRQGQVVGFDETDKKAPVRVWFGNEADHLIDYPFRMKVQLDKKYSIEPPPPLEQQEDRRTWNYARQALEICSAWSMQTLAERYFKRMWHTCYEPEELFAAGARDCDVENCPNATTKRIIFNNCGSVCSADVCDTCALKYHLHCGELFPWKRRGAQIRSASQSG